jgi:hypothetical protein
MCAYIFVAYSKHEIFSFAEDLSDPGPENTRQYLKLKL